MKKFYKKAIKNTSPMASVGQVVSMAFKESGMSPSSDRIENTKRIVYSLLLAAERSGRS